MREQINLMTDKLSNENLQTLYLDWVNNFTSSNAFADHHGITQPTAVRLIEKGREAHERIVAAAKITEKFLKNGAIEIARIEMGNGDIFVAADTNGMAGTQWATWAMDREGSTFWGHYFEDRDECLKDLHDRAYGG